MKNPIKKKLGRAFLSVHENFGGKSVQISIGENDRLSPKQLRSMANWLLNAAAWLETPRKTFLKEGNYVLIKKGFLTSGKKGLLVKIDLEKEKPCLVDFDNGFVGYYRQEDLLNG